VVQGSPFWLTAAGGEFWTYAAPALTDNRQYNIQSRAIDDWARVEIPSAGSTFSYDVSAPTSTIILPLDGVVLSVLPMTSGTAMDGYTSVQQVEVRINNKTTGKYWKAATAPG